MKMTSQEHRENAQDWLGVSDFGPTETVDRAALAEQFAHAEADAEDIEEIALWIERLARERRA